MVRGSIEVGGIVMKPSADGTSCDCVHLIRTNYAGQLPSLLVQGALALQCVTVTNVTAVRGMVTIAMAMVWCWW